MKWCLAIWMSVMLWGCKSTRDIKRVIEPKDYSETFRGGSELPSHTPALNALRNNYINFNTFSAKIKVDAVTKEGKQPEITAVVRMVKDSAIWVSLSATFLNIEVYRILIKPDEVILLNKQDKIVQYRTLEYLQEVTALPADFKTLQDILIGNPVYFEEPVVASRKQGSLIMLTAVGNVFKHLLVMNDRTHLPVHSKLDDVNITRNRTATISYSDYENIHGLSFSTYRHITVAEKHKIDLRMKYKQVEFNKELSVAFNVPKSYEIK